MVRAAWRVARGAIYGAVALTVAVSSGVQAQDKLRTQREELDRIRQERADLERRMLELRANVHDLSEEVANLNARRAATERLVAALDRQLASINSDVDEASQNMMRTETELADKRATLKRRLVDIYKRGPLFTTEVLLSAQSFGELVARYKYLHMLALHDRALVARVQELRDQVARDRDRLVRLQAALEQNRDDKRMEEDNLRDLERERASKLAETQLSARRTEQSIDRLRRTEAQLASTIASLEAERRRAEVGRGGAVRSASTIKTSDYGQLDWPVEGPLVYSFGKAQTASNATIRWNGVGIQAAVGTAVRAVASGTVVSVGSLGTYGTTVIIEHGGGDYSIYGSLARADVRLHETVEKGQEIGTVGISDPDYPPHLHFEIRHGGPAVDPASWLRGER
ncbi:MAG TPA: peptidoglycan DD-metalloendopeptidase family protein [Gemmatimonadaceae bacterium]|nr:peptidoglycan DD-metalloendopeptidase family protein [Gemmatimonadaceae bacterium]